MNAVGVGLLLCVNVNVDAGVGFLVNASLGLKVLNENAEFVDVDGAAILGGFVVAK